MTVAFGHGYTRDGRFGHGYTLPDNKDTTEVNILARYQQRARENEIAKGWVLPGEDPEARIPERLALVHSEVSEALEAYRTGDMTTRVSDTGKPEGFPSELADVIIRVFGLAESLGIDLTAELGLKMSYNTTRTHRHGGKRC